MPSLLTVETGAGLNNANSYISAADAGTLLIAHPDYAVYWSAKTADEQEKALIKSTEWLDTRFRFYGAALTRIQALQWPRTKNYDHHGILMPGGVVPVVLKKSTALMALQWVKETNLYNVVPETGLPKSVSIEGLSVSFDSGGLEMTALTGKRYPEVELMLKNLGVFKEAEFFESRRTDAPYKV